MTHVVIGYPSLAVTEQRVQQMLAAGVDMIELQIPFSDPIADGPAITAANQKALANGMTVEKAIAWLQQFVPTCSVPIIVIGYYNTVLHYGIEKFCAAMEQAKVTALTFPDMPISEEPYEQFYAIARNHHLQMIQLVSPVSTPERLQAITAQAEGYLYCVARFGVTGQGDQYNQLAEYLQRVRQYSQLPLAVGFGIKTPQQVKQLKGLADIAVVGSALLQYDNEELTQYLEQLCASR